MQRNGGFKAALSEHLNGTVWGALAGAVAVVPGVAIALIAPWTMPSLSELPFALGNLLLFSGYAFFIAFVAFFLGVLVFGAPVRHALASVGMEGPLSAGISGFALSAGAAGLLFGLTEPMSLVWVCAVAVAGAACAVAYRRKARS